MEFYSTFGMVHAGAAILLFLLAILSVSTAVLIAVKPGVDQANEKLVKKANTIGIIENIVAGIVTLTGVIAMIVGPWSLSQLWLWMSLLSMVFYSVTLIFVTKPARLAVAKGGSEIKVGMQVLLHMVYFLLIWIGFFIMVLKPV